MSISHQTARARSGELSIHYRRLGNPGQTPILIVHGLSYFSWDWLPAAQALGANREVIAMDMRGFGDSDRSPERDYSVPSMAQDILAVMDHAGWKRAVLMGHSMGGRSTTYVAAKQPELVAALVLVDYTPENSPAGTKRVAHTVANVPESFPSIDAAMQYFGKGSRERFQNYLRRENGGYVLKRDPHFREQFRRMLETGERAKLGVDMWGLIAEARCPILSLRGTRSDMYAPETVQKMHAANANLQVIEVEAGHDIAGENLRAFIEGVNEFLEANNL